MRQDDLLGCYISILANEIWFQWFSARDTANPQLNTLCQNQYKTSSTADVGWVSAMLQGHVEPMRLRSQSLGLHLVRLKVHT